MHNPRTDPRTDGRTDRRKKPLIEMRGRILKEEKENKNEKEEDEQ